MQVEFHEISSSYYINAVLKMLQKPIFYAGCEVGQTRSTDLFVCLPTLLLTDVPWEYFVFICLRVLSFRYAK